MRLGIIEDADVLDKVQRVLAASPVLRTAFELDRELSRRIMFERHYLSLLKAVDDVTGELALILDLGLIDKSAWPRVFQKQKASLAKPNPDAWEEQFIAQFSTAASSWMFSGLWVARRAIFNLNIKPLCILIASTGAGLRNGVVYLRKLAELAGRTSESFRVDEITLGLSAVKDDGTKELLDELRELCRPFVEEPSELDRVWHETRDWFPEVPGADLTGGIPPHTLKMREGLKPNEIKRLLSSYKDMFAKAFGIDLHSDVWQTFASVKVLHEVLKTFVGKTYRGNGASGIDLRNLSIGGVYLLLLLAEAQIEPNLKKRKWHKVVDRFDRYPYLNAPLFADQPSHIAVRAAQATYSLFTNLLQPLKEHGGTTVDAVELKDLGRTLKVCWDARWPTNKFVTKVAPLYSERDPLVEVWFSDAFPGKVLPALGALWRAQIASSVGFGSPGSVWMQREDLYFHSGAETAPIIPAREWIKT